MTNPDESEELGLEEEEASYWQQCCDNVQFPVAILAALQAGSIFYLVDQFNFVKEKHHIEDEMFEELGFWMNMSALTVFTSGLIISYLQPRMSAFLGGLFIFAAQSLIYLMVSFDHRWITKNSMMLLYMICFLSGQGAGLVTLSCLQALLNSQTIQSSAIVSTCIMCYSIGSNNMIDSIQRGLFPQMDFSDFYSYLTYMAFISLILNYITISDKEDSDGFFGKAQSLEKGRAYKKTNIWYLMILAAYTIILAFNFTFYDLSNYSLTSVGLVLITFNAFLPLLSAYYGGSKAIEEGLGEPSEIEKKLSNKGKDIKMNQLAGIPDFWFMMFASFVVIGGSRTLQQNFGPITMGNDELEQQADDTFTLYETLGCLGGGLVLVFLRGLNFSPSIVIAISELIMTISFGLMIHPQTFGDNLILSVKLASAVEGSLFVALSVFIHEQYGTENFALIFSIFWTAGAVGLFLLDHVFFVNVMASFAYELSKDGDHFLHYGDWNVCFYGVMTLFSFLGFLIAVWGHLIIRKDNKIFESTVQLASFAIKKDQV